MSADVAGAPNTLHALESLHRELPGRVVTDPAALEPLRVDRSGVVAAGVPVALVEAVLTAFSDPGDLVFEPFCGSGTQIIAAERTGRGCFAMELDPVYCDVAVRRWELATGRTAGRVGHQDAAETQPRRRRKPA